MSAAVSITRIEHSPKVLHAMASRSRRRFPALPAVGAMALEGASRGEAARPNGMDRQMSGKPRRDAALSRGTAPSLFGTSAACSFATRSRPSASTFAWPLLPSTCRVGFRSGEII